MNNLKEISISNYTYELPPERIAAFPLLERDSSKLLVYDRGRISENIFKNVVEYIPRNSLLLFNDTKVVNARLMFNSALGRKIEIFCLDPGGSNEEAQSAFSVKGSALWQCFVGNLKAWKNEILSMDFLLNGITCTLFAELKERHDDTFTISFSWKPGDITFAEVLEHAGGVPLPPYIKRDAVESDKQTYQTIYANYEGSVAAPTAGLHFTDNVLDSLKQKNIDSTYITLHVGAGTFKPVKSEIIAEHQMHSESFSVGKDTIEKIIQALKRESKIISIGTTTMRTVESLYWFGIQLNQNRHHSGSDVFIPQWEPYEFHSELPASDALSAVLNYMDMNSLDLILGRTSIIIVPGYDFKIFGGLITNFHQPGSTLLLLVAAFMGSDWKVVYDYALNNGFRFLSYGDSSILFR